MKKIWYSEKYGWVFPGKYWIFGALGIAGFFYFESNIIKNYFGNLGIWLHYRFNFW
mgnify:CR=1 FL=1